MIPIFRSQTEDLSLAEVVANLSRQPLVEGVVLVGSTGEDGALTAVSDYDILLLLSEMPVPLYVIFTTIESRPSDLIFSDTAFIPPLLTAEVINPDSLELASLYRWLQNGRIVYDADGRLLEAQKKLQQYSWQKEMPTEAIYGVWQGIHYNYWQTKRMLASKDMVYETAVDLRLTYMMTDVWFGYFTVRQLAWQGEKKAVRYWQANDPGYLQLFQAYQNETDRQKRFDLYAQLADWTLAPLGGLQEDMLVLPTLTGEWEMGDLETAVQFWHKLVQ